MSRREANYGIDGPTVFRNFLLTGFLGLALSLVAWRFPSLDWMKHLCWPAIVCLICALWMYIGSKIIKMKLRDKLVAELNLTGTEQVLDVGCGRGLLLLGIAKKLTTGRAVGADIWQTVDQSGNAITTTEQNARLEGVQDKVELHTANMEELPFADNRFDVIVSSWAIHNIYNEAGRRKAISEIARVLKPGGRLRILDISHTGDYVKYLRELGFTDVKRSGPNFLFMVPTRMVSATKPV